MPRRQAALKIRRIGRMSPMRQISAGRPFGFRFFPERAVDLFVEWRATGGVLAERMIFGPHQVRAVRERAADSLAVQAAGVGQLLHEVRLRQRASAESREGCSTERHIRGGGLWHEILQPTVPAADDRQRSSVALRQESRARG